MVNRTLACICSRSLRNDAQLRRHTHLHQLVGAAGQHLLVAALHRHDLRRLARFAREPQHDRHRVAQRSIGRIHFAMCGAARRATAAMRSTTAGRTCTCRRESPHGCGCWPATRCRRGAARSCPASARGSRAFARFRRARLRVRSARCPDCRRGERLALTFGSFIRSDFRSARPVTSAISNSVVSATWCSRGSS